MNKKFFTLMAAVMLAGAPLSDAFAALELTTPKLVVCASTDSHEFADGVKFVLAKDADHAYKVSKVDNTKTKKSYMTYAADGEVAVFEVCNFQSNAVAATFQLKVNGIPFALTTSGAAVISDTEANNVFTTFTMAPTNGEYLLEGATIKVVDGRSTQIKLESNPVTPYTYSKGYNSLDLNEFNASSTTLSFGSDNVEGNVFSGLTPVTFGSNVTGFDAGTYLVKGSKDDVASFKAITDGSTEKVVEALVKKLTFAAVTLEKWGLNTLTKGEGYKLAQVNGAVFFDEDAPLKTQNAKFTLTEFDQLNCEGELEVTAKIVLEDESEADVKIAAVKASSSDTKTYVTTLATSNSQYEEFTNPVLGANTFFAASEFLKVNSVSAYNIYFTSGTAQPAGSQPQEYGRYLSVLSDKTNFVLNATSPDSTNVNAPLSQWIVSEFDGKYTVTLQSREGGQTLKLQLEATSTAGQYKIAGGTGATSEIKNIVPTNSNGEAINTLKGKTIKLVPTTLTKNDGYLVLSKEEMAGKIALGFTGKNALSGERTYYLAPNAATPTAFKAALDGSATLTFKRVDDSDANKIETAYSYIDKDGKIAKDGVDTLYVPMYTLSYGSKPYYVSSNALALSATSTDAVKFIFKEHISGDYGMAAYTTDIATTTNVYGASAIHVKADNTFEQAAYLNALGDGDFAYVSVLTEDPNDYLTLEAVSRHATLESIYGAVAMQENKNGILEGILSAAPLTFWLDTADSEKATPAFYISVGIPAEEEAPLTKAGEEVVLRNFLFNPKDSAYIYDEGSATASTEKKYLLEGSNNLKAIFRPAALVAEDTLITVVDGVEQIVLKEKADASKGEVDGLSSFQFGIALADEDVEDEYVVKSKANNQYLYSLNGRLGFTADKAEALVVTLGEGDPTANEAIEAAGVQVVAGKGTVTVQGAAGKVITVANILGQTIANQVAASDNVTIAAPAGIVVVAVEGEATKVVVK